MGIRKPLGEFLTQHSDIYREKFRYSVVPEPPDFHDSLSNHIDWHCEYVLVAKGTS